MSDLDSQVPYWDAAAGTKTFTHPLHLPWLEGISRHAAILDYGCGYGRVMEELEQRGFGNLTGVDASPGMIHRARQLHPTMDFAALDAPPVSPYPDAGFDAVLLFAVLTCVPSDEAQHRLIAELNRILKPGGILYISDLLLQRRRTQPQPLQPLCQPPRQLWRFRNRRRRGLPPSLPRLALHPARRVRTRRHPDHHGVHHERA
ncbi:class I SAM-dependent methyltransferase [Streptomyces sp. NPDC055400]